MPASSRALATSVPSTANARVGRRRKADSAPVAAIQLITMHHSAGCINRLPMLACTSSPAENCQFVSASQPSRLCDPHAANITLTTSENASAPNARAGGRQNPATSGVSWLQPNAPASGGTSVAFASASPKRPVKYHQAAVAASRTHPAAGAFPAMSAADNAKYANSAPRCGFNAPANVTSANSPQNSGLANPLVCGRFANATNATAPLPSAPAACAATVRCSGVMRSRSGTYGTGGAVSVSSSSSSSA